MKKGMIIILLLAFVISSIVVFAQQEKIYGWSQDNKIIELPYSDINPKITTFVVTGAEIGNAFISIVLEGIGNINELNSPGSSLCSFTESGLRKDQCVLQFPNYVLKEGENEIILPSGGLTFDENGNLVRRVIWNEKGQMQNYRCGPNAGIKIKFNITKENGIMSLKSEEYSVETVKTFHFNTYQEFAKIGGFVSIKGSNFPENTQYTLYFNDKEVKNVMSDERGVIDDVFKITEELNPAVYTLNYTGAHFEIIGPIEKQNFITLKQGENIIDKQTFKVAKEIVGQFGPETYSPEILTIVLTAKVFPVPRSGEYGDSVKICAGGLKPGESYKIIVGSACEVPLPGMCSTIDFTADEKGEFCKEDVKMSRPVVGAIVNWLTSFFKTQPEGEKEIRNMEDDIKRLEESTTLPIELYIKTDPTSYDVIGNGFIIRSQITKYSEKYGIPLCSVD